MAYDAACILCPSHTPCSGSLPLFSSTGIMLFSYISSLSILPFSPSFVLFSEYSVLIFGVIACHRSSPVSPLLRSGLTVSAILFASNCAMGAVFWYASISVMLTFLSAYACFATSFLSSMLNWSCIFFVAFSSGLSVCMLFCSSAAIVSCSLCFSSPSIIAAFGGSFSFST